MADPKKPVTTIAPWQVLETKYSYRDRWLAVRSEHGARAQRHRLAPYHTIEFPEWVCAIALTPEREIVLIEEYRHGIERNSFELPCGTPDHEGESVLDATRRELREETGYAAEEWHALGSSTANTARQNNRVHAFLALDARKVAEPEFDAGEVISTHLVPWDTLPRRPGRRLAGDPGPAPRRPVAAESLRQADTRSAPAGARPLALCQWSGFSPSRIAACRTGKRRPAEWIGSTMHRATDVEFDRKPQLLTTTTVLKQSGRRCALMPAFRFGDFWRSRKGSLSSGRRRRHTKACAAQPDCKQCCRRSSSDRLAGPPAGAAPSPPAPAWWAR